MEWIKYKVGEQHFKITMQFPLSTHLDEGQHFVMHNGWRIVFGEDDPDQDTFDEVLASNHHMKAMPTVFDTRFKDLQNQARAHWEGFLSLTACLPP